MRQHASERAIAASRGRFAVGLSAALVSIGSLRGRAAGAEFQFRCATSQPLGHPSTVRLTQMWAAIERESGGRIHCDFFPASQLGDDTSEFVQLRTGAIHFLLISQANLASVVPTADMCFIGFAYKDSDEAVRVMDGPLGDYIRQDATSKGIHTLRGSWTSGMNQIGSTTRTIRAPADLHDFKIRVQQGRITTALFTTLGASPTALSLNEVYTALQTKLVDGEGASLISIVGLRLFEVNKDIALVNYGWAGVWLIANGAVWKSLPPDLQDLVERNNTTYSALERRDLKLLEASLIDQLKRRGKTVNPVDQTPFRRALPPYYEYWAKTFGPAAWGMLQTSLGRQLI